MKMDNKLIEKIFENPYLGICITDGKCNVIAVNESQGRITGFPKEMFIGKNMEALVENNVISISASAEVLRTGDEVVLHQVLSNGKHYDVDAIPIKGEEGEIIYIISFLFDVSEVIQSKEIAKKLKQNIFEIERKYEKLLLDARGNEDMVFCSKSMQILLEKAKRCATTDAPILITGPSGTGKELISEYIYKSSSRKNAKYSKINCAAIPENLLESELFGYEGGAFTGALKNGRIGLLEECDGGTVLFDEIGEMPIALQAKLLRFLQDSKIRRVGGKVEKKVDVRIIAATNADLLEKIKQKEFREDLLYRLNVIELKIPPLNQRTDDIPILINHFFEKFNKKYERNIKLSLNASRYLNNMNYEGNVRQLKNIVERLVIQSENDVLSLDEVLCELDGVKIMDNHLQGEYDVATTYNKSLKEMMDEYEKKIIREYAEKYKTSTDIAKKLKVDRTTISRKRKVYGI